MPKLVRIARDGTSVIAKTDTEYVHVSSDSKVLSSSARLSALVAGGSWRRPLSSDEEKYTALLNHFAPQPEPKERQLRLPKKMQESLTALSASDVLTDSERARVQSLVEAKKATASDAQWLLDLKDRVEQSYQTLSNETITSWAEKVSNPNEELSSFEASDDLQYFAAGDDPDSANVDTLLAVTHEGVLLRWEEDEFVEVAQGIDDYQREYLSQIGPADAKIVADWISSGRPGGVIDITKTDPAEANLFALAEAEMDFEFIDTLEAVVADATGYSREERRRNAMRQRRNNAGKFAPQNRGRIKPKKARKKSASGINADTAQKTPLNQLHKDKYTPFEQSRDWHYWHRARLRKLLPLILDSGQSVAEWIEENKALWNLRSYKPEPLAAAAEVEEVPNTEDKSQAIDNGTSTGLYFAIVDEVDHSAVLEIVAIKDDGKGNPEAWVRRGGQWVQDSQIMADLKGATPPPVVKLPDEEEVKSVISQIDEYDKKNGNKAPAEDAEQPVAAAAYSKKQRENDAERGYARPDGSYPIRNVSDLKNAIQAYGRANEEDRDAVRRHIRKRAKALNRTDLIPDSWKEAALRDFWDEVYSTSPLYGEHGEVIVAAGVPGVADTPSDYAAVRRLKNYWLYGEGGAKINWANPNGNMTRCIAHLSKYMPGRAAGYCQELHKEFYGGQTNQEVDKAAGI